ncbi:MAG: potassium-transporting ATPase subunit KdpC [Caldimicrobium sp.]
MRNLFHAVKIFVFLCFITGLFYPFLITGIAQVLFKDKAKGSIIYRDGKPVGSRLIAQPFVSFYFFWSRPSAVGYDALSSGGSSLGPTNPELYKKVKERVDFLKKNGINGAIPSHLVFALGSGLDPHLPPGAVLVQVERISRELKIPKDEILKLIEKHTEKRLFGFIGVPVVNVLELNLELLELAKKHE